MSAHGPGRHQRLKTQGHLKKPTTANYHKHVERVGRPGLCPKSVSPLPWLEPSGTCMKQGRDQACSNVFHATFRHAISESKEPLHLHLRTGNRSKLFSHLGGSRVYEFTKGQPSWIFHTNPYEVGRPSHKLQLSVGMPPSTLLGSRDTASQARHGHVRAGHHEA